MNKLLLTSSFLLIIAYCSGQSDDLTDSNLNNIEEVKNMTEKVLVLNMSDNSLLTFESLKEELISWKEKVKSVDIDNTTHKFTLVHLPILENRELFDVLNKYGIDKTSIISYK